MNTAIRRDSDCKVLWFVTLPSYFENLLGMLEKPRREIFGELPVHYTQCGHFLRPDTDRHTVDVLLDFK